VVTIAAAAAALAALAAAAYSVVQNGMQTMNWQQRNQKLTGL